MGIEQTLNERRQTHGDFGRVAKLHVELIECFRTHSTNTWEVDNENDWYWWKILGYKGERQQIKTYWQVLKEGEINETR